MDTTEAIATDWPVAVQQSFAERIARRDPTQTLTLVAKLKITSRWKEQELRWLHILATNMTAKLHDAIAERTGTPRDDGVLALIDELCRLKARVPSARELRDVLSARYAKRPGFTTKDFPLTGELRTGVFQKVAENQLAWFAKLCACLDIVRETQWIEEPHPKTGKLRRRRIDVLPPLATIYERWAAYRNEIASAGAQIMPFGRYRGRTLDSLGGDRRDLRWLAARIIDRPTAETVLRHVRVLLNRDIVTATALKQAGEWAHPWRTVPRWRIHEARPGVLPRGGRKPTARVNPIDQPQPTRRGQPVTLGTLAHAELRQFADQLTEYIVFADKYANLASAVQLLLQPAEPKPPTVRPIPTHDERGELERQLMLHQRRLMTPIRDSHGDTAATMLAYERDDAEQVLQASAQLMPTSYQPLCFTRTMRPPEQRACGVLFDKKANNFALAIRTNGVYAPRARSNAMQPSLVFVNFPNTEFVVPDEPNTILCSLEAVSTYHDARYLAPAMVLQAEREERARTAARDNQAASQDELRQQLEPAIAEDEAPQEERPLTKKRSKRSKQTPKPVSPLVGMEAALGASEITCHQTLCGWWEFFLHQSITLPTPPIVDPPKTFMGIHEHSQGYSYAIIRPDGSATCGDILIPKSVDPYENVRASDNYAFEVAVAIVRLAQTHHSFIAFEDTSWQRRPNLDRDANRQRFAQPSARIRTIVQYKAVLAGLLAPQFIWWGIYRRCPSCIAPSTAAGASTLTRRRRELESCPTCGQTTWTVERRSGRQRCGGCKRLWPKNELRMHCRACGTQEVARYQRAKNVAIRARELLSGPRTQQMQDESWDASEDDEGEIDEEILR